MPEIPPASALREAPASLAVISAEIKNVSPRIAMLHSTRFDLIRAVCLATMLMAAGGCTAFLEPREPYPITPPEPSPCSPVPREFDMVSLPAYVIEPPDILFVQAVKIVPKPPHKLEPFDAILVRVANAFADQPIADAFFISSGRRRRFGAGIRTR